MQKIILILVYGFIHLLFSPAIAQNPEGILTLTSSESAAPVDLWVKGDKMVLKEGTRPDQPGVKYVIEPDTKRFSMSTGNSGHLKVLVFNLVDNPDGVMINPFSPEREKAEKEAKVKFTKTKETRSIDGYDCLKWTYATEKESGEYWITQEFNFPAGEIFPALRLAGGAHRNFPDAIEGFLVEMKITDLETGSVFTLHNQWKPDTVDESLFQPVPGAKITDVSDMRRRIRDAADDPEKLKAILDEFN